MKIFVSSTYQDLKIERRLIYRILNELGHEPMFGIDPPPEVGKSPQEIINRTIEAADLVITIIGNRVGAIEPITNKPWTAFEFELANTLDKPNLIFIKQNENENSLRRNELVHNIKTNLIESRLVKFYSTPKQLGSEIILALNSYADRKQIKGETTLISIPSVNPLEYKALIQNPDELQRISPRNFEKLIADLLHLDGWDVNLIPNINAPGPDIIAISTKVLNGVPQKLIVECKRYAKHRPVDINVVRKVMYWVNEEYRSTMGMIVTSSRFTSEAKRLVTENHQWRLDLKSQIDIINWLNRIVK